MLNNYLPEESTSLELLYALRVMQPHVAAYLHGRVSYTGSALQGRQAFGTIVGYDGEDLYITFPDTGTCRISPFDNLRYLDAEHGYDPGDQELQLTVKGSMQPAIPEGILEISRRLNEQAATERSPVVYLVRACERTYAEDDVDPEDGVCWVTYGILSRVEVATRELSSILEDLREAKQEESQEPTSHVEHKGRTWRSVGYTEQWVDVMWFFTQKAAEAFVEEHIMELERPYIARNYGVMNPELLMIREYLKSLTAKKKNKSHILKGSRHGH